jgi:anti-sigma-K factor RskA
VNTREYIESGIIEQFVLGETTPEQTREVMSYAKQYPEIQAEIEAVEAALINLAASGGHKPKENTREQLFEKLFETPEPEKDLGGPAIMTVAPMSKQVAFNKKYLVAASVALLVSAAFNILLYSRLQDSEDALLALNNEKQQFATIMASQKESYSTLEEQMQKINSADVIQVKLAGLKLIPDARATVYYNTSNREVYLHVGKLPAAPADRQYQLWAIVDGKPVDAGVFDADGVNAAMLKMKSSDKPVTFAVTIEKRGGSANPTLEQMVLAGNMPS